MRWGADLYRFRANSLHWVGVGLAAGGGTTPIGILLDRLQEPEDVPLEWNGY